MSEKVQILFVPFTKVRRCHQKNVLIRKETYSVERVKELIKDVLFIRNKNESKIELDGDVIKENSG